MSPIRFTWDPEKDRVNRLKYRVSFEEAKTVLLDDFATEFFDEGQAKEEERLLLLGMSQKSRLLLVCHCFRDQDDVIRIISARKATRTESTYYRG
jgi:hypothetical protein